MKQIPTLEQILVSIPSGRDVLDIFRASHTPNTGHTYLHYSELQGTLRHDLDRQWAQMKIRRAATRMDLPQAYDLSLCMPNLLYELMFDILAPLDEDLSLIAREARYLDRSESIISDAIALCQLDDSDLDPLAAAHLLRTRCPAKTHGDELLKEAFRRLSAPGESAVPDAGLHPLLQVGVDFIVDQRNERREALLEWRQGLRHAGVPGLEMFAPVAHLDADSLDRALGFMESDEQDATYPLVVLLAALLDSRRAWRAAARRRAERVAKADADTNIRQVLVLDQVATSPQFATSLAHHKSTFGVVYETARTDLQELAHRGQLALSLRKRAFVFTAGDGTPRSTPVREPGTVSPAPVEDSLPVFF